VSDTSQRRSVLWQTYHPFPPPTQDILENTFKARVHGNALALLYFREIGYDDCNFEHEPDSKFPRGWKDTYSVSETIARKNQSLFDITSPSLAVMTNGNSKVVDQREFDKFLGALLRTAEGSKQAAYVAFGYVQSVVEYADEHCIALFIFTKDVEPSYKNIPPLNTVDMYPKSMQKKIAESWNAYPHEHCPTKNGAIFPYNDHAKSLAACGPGQVCHSFMSYLGVSTSITEELLKERDAQLKERDAEVEELQKQVKEQETQLKEQETQLKALQEAQLQQLPGPSEKRPRVS
jgi:hypothetical protein